MPVPVLTNLQLLIASVGVIRGRVQMSFGSAGLVVNPQLHLAAAEDLTAETPADYYLLKQDLSGVFPAPFPAPGFSATTGLITPGDNLVSAISDCVNSSWTVQVNFLLASSTVSGQRNLGVIWADGNSRSNSLVVPLAAYWDQVPLDQGIWIQQGVADSSWQIIAGGATAWEELV